MALPIPLLCHINDLMWRNWPLQVSTQSDSPDNLRPDGPLNGWFRRRDGISRQARLHRRPKDNYKLCRITDDREITYQPRPSPGKGWNQVNYQTVESDLLYCWCAGAIVCVCTSNPESDTLKLLVTNYYACSSLTFNTRKKTSFVHVFNK